MRRGELVGLQLRDLDMDAGRLLVRSATISVGYEVCRSDPKTRKGNRTIDLDDRALTMLHERRRDQDAERSAQPSTISPP